MFPVRMFTHALLAPPDGRLLRRSLLNAALSLSVSLLMVFTGLALLEAVGVSTDAMEAPDLGSGGWAFFNVVVLAPLLETLMLAGLLALLPARCGLLGRAALSALLWGGLHASTAPFWFVGTVFPFFVFSCSYLVWRPVSFRSGFVAAALPHALQNLVVMVLTSAGG